MSKVKFMTWDCNVSVTKYSNGNTALQLWNEEEGRLLQQRSTWVTSSRKTKRTSRTIVRTKGCLKLLLTLAS